MMNKFLVAFLLALVVVIAEAQTTTRPAAPAAHDPNAEPEGNSGTMLASAFGFVISAFFAAVF